MDWEYFISIKYLSSLFVREKDGGKINEWAGISPPGILYLAKQKINKNK